MLKRQQSDVNETDPSGNTGCSGESIRGTHEYANVANASEA